MLHLCTCNITKKGNCVCMCVCTYTHIVTCMYKMCSTCDVYGFNYITMQPLSLGYVLGIRWLSLINLSYNVITEFMVVFSIQFVSQGYHMGMHTSYTFIPKEDSCNVWHLIICITYTHWQNHVSGNYGYLYKQRCVFWIIYGPDL